MTQGTPVPAGTPAGVPSLDGVRLDPNKLKIRELVAIEKLLGRRVAEDMMTGLVGADFMQALLWTALKRQDPGITYEQAGDYDFEQVEQLLADAADGDSDPVAADAVDPPPAPPASVSSASSPAPASSNGSPSSAPSTT